MDSAMMDFTALLQMAKKNAEDTKNNKQYYSTKYAPPKKESKESKRLSENIRKFLDRREQEEKEREEARRQQVANLQAMRSQKSKGRISRMLKVTKSSNKAVLEDAINQEHTAISMAGPDQPDQDDYGYVSAEANAFYQKYIEKVKHVTEDKGFPLKRPTKDLDSTRERVKSALKCDAEGKNIQTHRQSNQSSSSSSSSNTDSKKMDSSAVQTNQKKSEEKKDQGNEKKKNKKPMPPPMDFHALIKLAEQKQHEPVIIPTVKKEPERLMNAKEKRQLEEIKLAREARERQRKEELEKRKNPTATKPVAKDAATFKIPTRPVSNNTTHNKTSTTNGKIPTKQTATIVPKNTDLNKGSTMARTTSAKPAAHSNSSQNSSLPNKKSLPTVSNNTKINDSASSIKSKATTNGQNVPQKTTNKATSTSIKSKTPIIEKTREFPPRDLIKSSFKDADRIQSQAKRKYDKYFESEEEEDDSEMDDFIDDGEEDQDYSSHIKEIFGYDKSKYRHIDEEDDRNMESSFAQVQREEYISKKIGIQEDLEDMEMEAREKKRKMMLKKRRLK